VVRSGKPTLLVGRRHDLSVHELAAAPVDGWIEPEHAVLLVTAPQPQKYHPRQLVVLSNLRLDPAGLGGRKPVTGSVGYRKLGPTPGPLVLRLTGFRGVDTWSLFAYFEGKQLAERGVLKFSLPHLLPEGLVPEGTLVGFAEFGCWEKPGQQGKFEVVSNALTFVLLLRQKQLVPPKAK
jgi:hypothetical protein